MTDIKLHVATRRKPLSFIRSIFKTIRSGKPRGRYYQNGNFSMNKGGEMKFTIPMPPNVQEQIDTAKKEGKIVRFIMPKGGIPVFMGDDTIEFLNSPQGRGYLHLTPTDRELS